MRWVLVLALALGTCSWASPRSFAARCQQACLVHVREPTLAATVCGRCFVEGAGDRGGWALRLAKVSPLPRAALESAATDPDWAVRWGASRALAMARKVEVARELAERVGQGRGEAALRACLTATRGAATRKLALADFFAFAQKPGDRAAQRCGSRRAEIRSALELELYSADRTLQAEALEQLAFFLEESPAQVVLGAMAERPAEADGIAAAALLDVADRGGLPVGRALIQGAGAADGARVNRLLAVYSAEIDRQRATLASPEPSARRAAVAQLANLGPLGARELEAALADEDAAVRLSAARGLARGEGLSIAGLVKAKLSAPNPPATQVRWVELVGRAAEPGCAALLAATAVDARLDEEVRGAAYAALGACRGARALPQVRAALSSTSAKVRAGAVVALGSMPRVPEAERAAAAALWDPSPAVLAAAARTVATQRQRGKLEQLSALTAHASAEVRAAAVEALGAVGDGSSARPLSERLTLDPSVEVRVAAARALGVVGGPFAISALADASTKDSDGRVRFLANESLRRLGFRR